MYSIRQKDREEGGAPGPAVLSAVAKLETLAARLAGLEFPHVCLYGRVEVSPALAYAVRPFVWASLHERATLRPFLSREEQRWVAYQLLVAVGLAHRSGVRHGDLKAENVGVTSWGWVLLLDFAPYKPVYLDVTNTGAGGAGRAAVECESAGLLVAPALSPAASTCSGDCLRQAQRTPPSHRRTQLTPSSPTRSRLHVLL